MPKYYPMLLNLEDQPALVVGGGPVASRKAALMLEYGARVTIVAKKASDEAREVAADPRVVLHERAFEMSDLDTPVIVFAATNDTELHVRIKTACDERRIACNIVDVPELCGFIVPSIIRRGELMITISTDGMCPSYAKYQRQRMTACCFPEGCESMLHVAAAARNELKGPLGHGWSDEEKFGAMRELLEGDLKGILAEKGEAAACAAAIDRVRSIVGSRRGTRAQSTGSEA